MNGWNRWSIRQKLFSVILLILAIHIVVLVFMGSTLFSHFYQSNKVSELKNSAKRIKAAYEQNSELVYDEIDLIESQNVQVSLLSMDMDGGLEVVYASRPGRTGKQSSSNLPPPQEINDRRATQMEEEMLARLATADESLQVEMGLRGDKPWEDSLWLTTKLSENLYLHIQTSRDYIKSTADLAVKYTAFLSIGILLAGAAVVYFVAGKVTKPIQRIQEAADRISRMDFTQKCEVTGGDEISMLATSINHMSDGLEASIEQLKQANVVLQNDLIRQQQTDRMRQQFVANVSHDFKTPLTLMISYAEALADYPGEEIAAEYCEIIISEGNKLSSMVGRLLNLSKLESGIDKTQQSIFCLNEVLDAVLKNHRILTEKQGIQVLRQVGDEYIVQADYQKIQQVVTNLFENAVKYTPVGGKITVATQEFAGKCRISVENTGDPIGKEDLENLFESFYRGDKARTVDQSFGLGLAIVKVVMEAHHQAYGVENTRDGVLFWFELESIGFEEEEDLME